MTAPNILVGDELQTLAGTQANNVVSNLEVTGTLSVAGVSTVGVLDVSGLAVGSVVATSAEIGDLVVGSNAPATAASTGVTGTVTWDADFIYVCTDTDTWVRAAIATWV
jgi:hypothetical protein